MTWRILYIWGFALAGLTGLYVALSHNRENAPSFWLFVTLSFLVTLAWVSFEKRRAIRRARGNLAHDIAVARDIAQGNLDGAIHRLDASPSPRPEARSNLAFALMQRGEMQRALTLIEPLALLKSKHSLPRSEMAALAHALSGNEERAKKWLTIAESRRPREDIRTRGGSTLVRAVLACRRGDAQSVEGMLAPSWLEMERAQMGFTMRPLRAVRAFALATTLGADAEDRVTSLLACFSTRAPRELAWLGASWPEMKSFLEARHLHT